MLDKLIEQLLKKPTRHDVVAVLMALAIETKDAEKAYAFRLLGEYVCKFGAADAMHYFYGLLEPHRIVFAKELATYVELEKRNENFFKVAKFSV